MSFPARVETSQNCMTKFYGSHRNKAARAHGDLALDILPAIDAIIPHQLDQIVILDTIHNNYRILVYLQPNLLLISCLTRLKFVLTEHLKYCNFFHLILNHFFI